MTEPKIALVTGASRGAGAGIARGLGEKGMTVYVTGRTTAPGDAKGWDGTVLPGTVAETAEAVTKAGGKGIAVLCDHSDDAQVAALFAQLQARIAAEEKLRYLAEHDDLTGLYNRRYLGEALPSLVSMASRLRERIVVILIDLDHFKAVNDDHGHEAGDLVLQRFSDVVHGCIRSGDLFAPYSGWELFQRRDNVATGVRNAAAKWRGRQNGWAEGDSQALRLALRGRDPFTDTDALREFARVTGIVFGAVTGGAPIPIDLGDTALPDDETGDGA